MHDLIRDVRIVEQYSLVEHHILLSAVERHGWARFVGNRCGKGSFEPLRQKAIRMLVLSEEIRDCLWTIWWKT